MPAIPKIIDNKRRILLDTLVEVSADFEEISIATGYWDLEATKSLLPFLQNYKKIRLLIGREPQIPRHHLDAVEPDFPDTDIFEDLQRLKPDSPLKETVSLLKKLIEDKVLTVKVYKRSFLHAKCYIFGNIDSEKAIGIIGSSNFTKAGLSKNLELNSSEEDHRVVQFQPRNTEHEHGHLSWFEEVWTDESCVDWTGNFIELVDTSVHGEKLFSPYEMYIHSLYTVYKDQITDPINLHQDSEKILHAFQIRNAQLLLSKLKQTGIAMLADSVGLGKTITAGAVIKKYLNDKSIKNPRVEVIVPASIKSQWINELAIHHQIFDGSQGMHISSLQNKDELIQRKKFDDHWDVDLFVIDEAHNLRHANGERYKQLVAWIQHNTSAHVLLVTATPINNQLTDFATQIDLAAGGQENLFFVQLPKMGNKGARIKDHYDAIVDLNREISQDIRNNKPIDTEKITKVMRPILRHFMVRSTRQGILSEFGGIKDETGKLIKFPVPIPKEERYIFKLSEGELLQVDDQGLPLGKMLSTNINSLLEENRQLSRHPLDLLESFQQSSSTTESKMVEKVFLLTAFLGLPIYRSTIYNHDFFGKSIVDIKEKLSGRGYTKEEKLDIRQQLTVHNLMRILFLKRVESSVFALKKSIENYDRRLRRFEEIIRKEKKIVRVSNINDFTEMLLQDISDQEMQAKIEEISLPADPSRVNIDAFLEDITKDQKIIKVILELLTHLLSKDAKIAHFQNALEASARVGKKVLVFSYFADTIEYLQDYLLKKCDLVTSENAGFTSGKSAAEIERLAERFSPISKKYELGVGETELQFLFSTDVLSEGQNLQDCDILYNYDLHWNPVRMIQRNGRINRLGSSHSEVYIHNLCPAEEIEAYLKLERRLKQKIDIIRSSIGTDAKILGEDENPLEFTDSFSEKDEKDLQTTLNLYGSEAAEAITKFEIESDILVTDDVFVADLRRFHEIASDEEKHRVYHRIPLGKWSTRPSSKLPETPDVLVHSLVEVTEGESKNQMSVFFATTYEGATLSFVDQIDALSLLQCPINYPQHPLPAISHSNISSLLDENFLQSVQNALERRTRTLLPHQEVVLDAMHARGQPDHLISKALKESQNRLDRRYISRLVKILHGNLKNSEPFDPETLTNLLQKVEKVCEKIELEQEAHSQISSDPIIHSFHASP